MSNGHLVLGTRGSALALRQAQLIQDALRRVAPDTAITVTVIRTHGDRVRDAALDALGGTGVFVKEIEAALLGGEIDLAVHSLKDLPTEMAEGLTIAAVPPREDARDALLSAGGKRLADLPAGAQVGTSSPRRRAQLLHQRPDLQVRDLRGNLDTRIRRLDEGRYDAIILAVAGLRRLGLDGRITERLPLRSMVPAVGQGALAVQVRRADRDLQSVLSALDDDATRTAVTAERSFLVRLGGGCHVPAGAHARVTGDRLDIDGCVASPAGDRLVRRHLAGRRDEAEALGVRLAESLLEAGGRDWNPAAGTA